MSWGRAVPILLICAVFDALRFICEQFWFFGPAIATAYCTTKGIILGTACTTTVAAIGFFGSAAITAFGVIMAMAVGLFGWMTIGLALIMTNARIFKENASGALHFALGLLVSEIPIIGTLPAFTISVARMYHTQIKKEKEDLKQYEEERAAELQANERRERQIMQMRATQQAQLEATIEEQALQEEIPEEVRETA